MLLFSSRDHLSIPGLYLWALITAVRLQYSNAFDILSPKSPAPSSHVPSPISSLSTMSSSSSFPSSKLPFTLSSLFSSLSSSSSTKLNSLSPTRLYLRYLQEHSKSPHSYSSSLEQSDATPTDAKPTHSIKIVKRDVTRFIPSSSRSNLITFTSGDGNDIQRLPTVKPLWTTQLPMMRQTTAPKIPHQKPTDISSVKEKQKLKSYFQHVERMKSLKSTRRRKLKEKAILKSKLLKAASIKKNRLSKMAKVEVVALAKSPPGTQMSRSVKARRADFFMHGHGHLPHSGRHGFGNVKYPAGDFIDDGFINADGSFVQPGNEDVFQGFDSEKGSFALPSGSDGFVLDHLPNGVNFIVNGQSGFLPQSSSDSDSMSHSIPRPYSSASSPFSSSSASSSSARNDFGQFHSNSNQDLFGGFIDQGARVDQPAVVWQDLPSSQPDQFLDMFPSDDDISSSMISHKGGFHIPSAPVSNNGFRSSPWGGSTKLSSSSPHNRDSFGSFVTDDRDCATITTKTCRSSSDCVCNGFYKCMGSRCIAKGSSRNNDGDDDDLGGMWHGDPMLDSVVSVDEARR